MAGRVDVWAAPLAAAALGCSGPDAPNLPFVAGAEPGATSLAGDPERGSGAGEAPVRLPFVVDDHFHATGCMSSDADCGSARLSLDTRRCQTPRPEGAQGQCYHFRYEPAPGAAAGRYALWLWQYGDDNWGASPGLPIEPGARRIRFAAAASSRVRVTFRAGGTNLPRQPDARLQFQDDFSVELEVELEPALVRYELPLEHITYSRVISGFGWMLAGGTEAGAVEFFVDDIRWE